MIKIDQARVRAVTWAEDPDTYDHRLHALGHGHDEFVIVNPDYDPWILDYIDYAGESNPGCVVWAIENLWLVKKFRRDWDPATGWKFIHCELDIAKTVEFNPEVKFINQQLRDCVGAYNISIEDLAAEHVWYTKEQVWVARARADNVEITGHKSMGIIGAQLEYNPDIPPVSWSISTPEFYHYDYNYELVWYIDPRFNTVNDRVWLARFRPDSTEGVKDMGHVMPCVEYNPDIPRVEYADIEPVPYHDLCYELVWNLDPRYNLLDERIWAIRILPDNSQGYKDMGYVTPKLEYNPDIPRVEWDIKPVPYQDFNYTLTWYLHESFNDIDQKIWAAKLVPLASVGDKDMGYVTPKLEYNPDIPAVDFSIEDTGTYHDFIYDLVWYLDPKYVKEDDHIWAVKIAAVNSRGIKDMGYIEPKLEFNPDIPKVSFDSDFATVYQDLCYQHVWYLDSKFNPTADDVWLARITPRVSQGVKHMGYVEPVLETNPDIPAVDFELPNIVPYYEFDNNLIWYLDSRFNPTDDQVWALRLRSNRLDAGDKDMGTVSPKFILNPDIPKELEYYIDDHVPYFDLGYEHVWMLDDTLHKDNERIWAAKIVPKTTSLGVKVVGNIGVKMGNFDVVFISYFEPNAEANWQKLKEVCPTALRVKNVKGIFEAHKQAAELATTDMFYVVDGDAEILDTWKFDYRPNVFDLDVVHLWTSLNPINGLEYGYGGVKLFPRKLLLEATTWNIDLTTGLGKLMYIPKVSNITAFNTDPFNTWRSAFRECAKLSSSLHLNAYSTADTEERLRIWTTVGSDKKYGEYALHGANLGLQYGLDNFSQPEKLKLINNFEWMKNEFDKFFKQS